MEIFIGNFIGSFIVFILSGLALALGFLLRGKPLRPGCGHGKTDCQRSCGKQRCPNKPDQPVAPPEV